MQQLPRLLAALAAVNGSNARLLDQHTDVIVLSIYTMSKLFEADA